MGIMKNIRSVLPIPRAWEQDSDRKNFALRVETALRELFSRRVAKIRINGNEVSTDDHDVADLVNIVVYQKLTCANGENNFTVSANSRIRIDLLTTNAGRMGTIMASGNASGSNVYFKADVGSAVTVTASGGTLVITTNNPIDMFCTVYAGSIVKQT